MDSVWFKRVYNNAAARLLLKAYLLVLPCFFMVFLVPRPLYAVATLVGVFVFAAGSALNPRGRFVAIKSFFSALIHGNAAERAVYTTIILLCFVYEDKSMYLWWGGMGVFAAAGFVRLVYVLAWGEYEVEQISGVRRYLPWNVARSRTSKLFIAWVLMFVVNVAGASALLIIMNMMVRYSGYSRLDDSRYAFAAIPEDSEAYDATVYRGRLFVNTRPRKAGRNKAVSGGGLMVYSSGGKLLKTLLPGEAFERNFCHGYGDETCVWGSYESGFIYYVNRSKASLEMQLNARTGSLIDNDADAGGNIYIMDESGKFVIIDRKSMRMSITGSLSRLSNYYSFGIDPAARKLYVTSYTGGEFCRYSLPGLKREKCVLFPAYSFKTMAMGGLVYIALPTRSAIGVYDGDTLKPIRMIRTCYGVRDFQFSDGGRYVHSACYFSNTYQLIDVRKGKVVEEVHFRNPLRGVYYDESSWTAYAISGRMVYKIPVK